MIDKQSILKIISDYFSEQKEVVAVYLFGSFAVDTNKPFSDIDIALLLDRDRIKDFNQQRRVYLAKLSRCTRMDIDLVIMNTASEGLLKQIYANGKCLVVNDDKQLASFNMISFSNIADFAYNQKIMQSGVINSILKGGAVG
ncbi:MAG: nucleotidyltransferase domain-containing protein [Desulfatitalea sp.]